MVLFATLNKDSAPEIPMTDIPQEIAKLPGVDSLKESVERVVGIWCPCRVGPIESIQELSAS
jgi:hypothetical protein